VAEQLALEQRRAESGAVDAEERRLGAGRATVQLLGEEISPDGCVLYLTRSVAAGDYDLFVSTRGR